MSQSPTTSPRVSVVIPTHRRPEMLRRALETLETQTFPRDQFEVIVVATEGDVAYSTVGDFRARGQIDVRCVSVPIDPSNGRSASAKRNHGVAESRAPWVAFMDDDCYAHEAWLATAATHFDTPNAAGVEGEKAIPRPDRETMVYRGLLLFTRPRGYQTCNIFYRKEVFQKLGGFDLNFPYYLEDSDLAWAVLDAGYEIPYAAGAIVYHPVPPPHPWKILDDAKRAELMPYLYKKHPHQYRASGVKVLRWSHWVYIALYASIVACLFAKLWLGAIVCAAAVLGFVALHSFKLFRGCATTAEEFSVTTMLLPALPVVKWFQLMRGNLKHRVWLWT